jgi:hypothetical protein
LEVPWYIKSINRVKLVESLKFLHGGFLLARWLLSRIRTPVSNFREMKKARQSRAFSVWLDGGLATKSTEKSQSEQSQSGQSSNARLWHNQQFHTAKRRVGACGG